MTRLPRVDYSAMVRPVVTILLVVVLCYLVVTQVSIPEMFGTLVVSVISYWFGERSKGK